MKKKFLINLALLVLLNALVKPFWIFGIDRSVQNLVGAGEYGLYFSLFSFSLLLNILLDLGITSFNNREIARNPHVLQQYFSNMVGLKLMLGVLFAFVSYIVARIVGFQGRQIHLLWFLIINQFLASFLLYLRSNLSGLHFFKTDSLLSVLDRILMIAICSLLLWGNVVHEKFEIEWYVYAQTAAYLGAVMLAFIFVLMKAKFFRIRFQRAFFIKILKKSYPFALLAIMMSVYYRIDSVMLERMLPDGDVQAGIYAQAFRILDAFTMFAFLFATLLLPMFSRMIKKGESVEELTSFSLLLLMIPVLILSIVLIFYRQPFMGWLYHEHTAASARVLSVLMVAYIFISMSYIYGTLLTAGGYMKILNITAGASLFLNIVMNVILIPAYHAYGSAGASMGTQGLVFFIQIIFVFRIFRFKKHMSLIQLVLIFMVGVFLLGWSSTFLSGSWLVRATGVIFISLVLAFLLALPRIRDLIRSLRKREVEKEISYPV